MESKTKHSKVFWLTVIGGVTLLFLSAFFSLRHDRNDFAPTERGESSLELRRETGEEADEEGEEPENPEGEEEYPVMGEPPQPAMYVEVTQADCQNECSAFRNDQEKLRYCRSYCGLADEEGQAPSASGSCEGMKNVERDRCIKDEAVEKQEIERCDDIYDENLRKSCQARVTEDYFP